MIDLYTWTTPNGRKVSMMLEECGLPYTVHPVNIREGQQFKPEFVAICPNSKIPAIVDGEADLSLFESGAILIHLAEKTGRFLPARNSGDARTPQRLLRQTATMRPMTGPANHIADRAAEQGVGADNEGGGGEGGGGGGRRARSGERRRDRARAEGGGGAPPAGRPRGLRRSRHDYPDSLLGRRWRITRKGVLQTPGASSCPPRAPCRERLGAGSRSASRGPPAARSDAPARACGSAPGGQARPRRAAEKVR